VKIHAGARSFDEAAPAYERARPSYPAEAVSCLVEELAITFDSTVVDLGAGTGKLTRLLLPHAGRVVAVEPLEGMWRRLVEAEPDVAVVAATAEAIPLADGSAGAVTAGQAFHWFRAREALAEIHRVLRPGGRLGLVWNRRDVTVDWVAAMDAVLDRYERETPRFKKREWSKAFSPEAPFTALESRSFRHEQEMTSDLLADRVLSISFVAALPDHERAQVLDEVGALVEGFPERFPLPYVTELLWCTRR